MIIRLYREKFLYVRDEDGTMKRFMVTGLPMTAREYVRDRKERGEWTPADHARWYWVFEFGYRKWKGKEHIRTLTGLFL